MTWKGAHPATPAPQPRLPAPRLRGLDVCVRPHDLRRFAEESGCTVLTLTREKGRRRANAGAWPGAAQGVALSHAQSGRARGGGEAAVVKAGGPYPVLTLTWQERCLHRGTKRTLFNDRCRSSTSKEEAAPELTCYPKAGAGAGECTRRAAVGVWAKPVPWEASTVSAKIPASSAPPTSSPGILHPVRTAGCQHPAAIVL